MIAVDSDEGKLYFYMDTVVRERHICGRPYAALHEMSDIVLPVTSSSIVSLLLHKDRVAHSRFSI